MDAEATPGHTLSQFEVDVAPDPALAGHAVVLVVRAACVHGCDLRGHGVLVKDADGALVARAELVDRTAEGAATSTSIELTAPVRAGAHVVTVEFPVQVRAGTRHQAADTTATLTALAHPTTVMVWDVPSTVSVAETFMVTVGVKCSAGCRLEGRHVQVTDDRGRSAGTGSLGSEPLPGTDGLFTTQIELSAPSEPGAFPHEARFLTTGAEPPHESGAHGFHIKAVPPAEHTVRVKVALEDGSPLSGASVVLHPYRSKTDERGDALLHVTAGTYALFVSGAGCLTQRLELDVGEDVEIPMTLVLEPAEDPHEYS